MKSIKLMLIFMNESQEAHNIVGKETIFKLILHFFKQLLIHLQFFPHVPHLEIPLLKNDTYFTAKFHYRNSEIQRKQEKSKRKEEKITRLVTSVFTSWMITSGCI